MNEVQEKADPIGDDTSQNSVYGGVGGAAGTQGIAMRESSGGSGNVLC